MFDKKLPLQLWVVGKLGRAWTAIGDSYTGLRWRTAVPGSLQGDTLLEKIGGIGRKQGSLGAGRYQGALCIGENPRLWQSSVHENVAQAPTCGCYL